MGTRLQISLLGGCGARTASGAIVRLPGKTAALLACLAMAGDRGQPRESLAGLLWEEASERRARASLRQALTVLRQALGPLERALSADRQRVQLAASAVEVDALHFEELAAVGTPGALEMAAVLYRGDFLQGLRAGSERFEDWASAESLRLLEMYKDVLARLIAHYETSGDVEKAIATAIRLLAIDPLREDIHRKLIGLYLRENRRGDALKQFDRCRAVLRRELQAEPEVETLRLVEGVQEPAGELPRRSLERPAAEVAGCTVAVLPFRVVGPGDVASTASFILREGIEFSLSRFREIRTIITRAHRRIAPAGNRGEVEWPPEARFLVEGAIEQRDQLLVIAVRLLENPSGACLWEEQFRKHRTDYLEIEERVVRRIVACIHPAIIDCALARLQRDCERLDSRGLAFLARTEARRLTVSSLEAAVRLAKRAIALDAGNSLAFSTLALARVSQIRMGWGAARCLPEAVDAAEEALVLDYADANAHGVRGFVHLWERRHEAALRAIARGLDLNPNNAELLHWYGLAHDFAERPEEALALQRAATELAPRHPWTFAATNAIAGAGYEMEAFHDAVWWARQSIAMNPSYRRGYVVLAASLARLGDEAGARRSLSRARALDPSLCLKMQLSGLPYKQPETAASWERGYRLAGLR